MPKGTVVYRAENYILVSLAARRVRVGARQGVHPQTLLRWVKTRKEVNGQPIRAIQDPMSRRYYVLEKDVERMSDPDRFFEVVVPKPNGG